MRHPDYSHVILSRQGKNKPQALPLLDAVASTLRSGQRYDCHLSIARYTPDLVAHVNGNGRLKGYGGPCYSDYLGFDLDRGGAGHRWALGDARQLAITLHEAYGLREDQVRYFYSGSKGYHLLVPMLLAGEVEPSALMPQILRRMAVAIAGTAGVEIDQGLYTRLGMMRAPGTQHPRTQAWKTEFSWAEFSTWTPEQILEAATGFEPREFAWQAHDLEESDALVELYGRCALEAEEYAARPRPEPKRQRDEPIDVASVVEIMRAYYTDGQRHSVALALSGYLAKQGVRQEDAEAVMGRLAAGDVDGGEKSLERVTGTYGAYADGVDVRGWTGLQDVMREDDLEELAGLVEPGRNGGSRDGGLALEDFEAYMPDHRYIYHPTGDTWPSTSVNARIPPVPLRDAEGNILQDKDGKPKTIPANTWLDQNRPVVQMTWYPGEPRIIEGRIFAQGGGWVERDGCRVFNLYRPPNIELGNPAQAARWIDHVHRVFPDEAGHIIRWLAQRVQQPHVKINHALALIGSQGTGKDTCIEGAVPAVGDWNVYEAAPEDLMGRFNPHRKSVILRVSEARDMGDTDRYRLYEHMKVLTAAPPSVLMVDEKHLRQYMIPNLCGVVVTSNHTDGLYIPPDDRRHFVAYTELTKDDFTEDYWTGIYEWYEREGCGHIAAYLHELNISDFNPKAPPPKTAGFWTVVDAGRAPEDAELADILDRLMEPDAVTLSMLVKHATDASFGEWLGDRKNSRQIPHRMESAGYIAVRNDGAKDGKWKISGKRQVVYARRELMMRDRIAAARELQEAGR